MGEEAQPIMEEEAKPSRRKLWIGIAIICVIAAISSFALIYQLVQVEKVPWFFEGAYGEYSGATTLYDTTIDFSMRIEILETSMTKAKLLLHLEMACAEYPELNDEYSETMWVDPLDKSYTVEGYTLVSTREDDIYFSGFGNRRCVICEYSDPESTMTMYMDKETDWILRMVFYVTDFTMDLTLIETNIPELEY